MRAVAAFRETHPEIVRFWARLGDVLEMLATGESGQIGPVGIEDGTLVLPNGLRMIYQLRWDPSRGDWMRMARRKEVKIWGGHLAENVCSSLARVSISDVMLRAQRELGIRPAFSVHDSLVYCVPEERAEELKAKVLAMMHVTPTWWVDGPPLAAEGTVTDRYGEG